MEEAKQKYCLKIGRDGLRAAFGYRDQIQIPKIQMRKHEQYDVS